MARIRSVHPGLHTDEAIVSVSFGARWLFIGILMECDDQGAFEWKPLGMKMRLLPADNVDCVAMLDELIAANIVARYECGGRHYGAVRNFGRFQSPKKPKIVHPMPPQWRTYAASKASSSPPEPDEPTSVPPKPEVTEGEVLPFPELRGADPPPVLQKSENARQMEDGGWKREDEGGKEERPFASLTRSFAVQPQRFLDPFDEFWAAYPRKTGKDDARKIFERVLKRGVSPAQIAEGLSRQRWPTDPKFIPYPARWLNGGRWQDDPDAAAPPDVSSGGKYADYVNALWDDAPPSEAGPIIDVAGHA
jgi:hypothetical protein